MKALSNFVLTEEKKTNSVSSCMVFSLLTLSYTRIVHGCMNAADHRVRKSKRKSQMSSELFFSFCLIIVKGPLVEFGLAIVSAHEIEGHTILSGAPH